MIDDLDDFYDIVGRELADGNVDAGLMARSLAESGGDQGMAMSYYVRYRVQSMVAAAAAATEHQRAKAERQREQQKAEETSRRREDLIPLVEDLNLSPLFDRLTVSTPGLSCLAASERISLLLKWDGASEIYQIAYSLHYRKRDLEGATDVYRYIIARFPEAVECGYARSQLENIAAMDKDQWSASAEKQA